MLLQPQQYCNQQRVSGRQPQQTTASKAAAPHLHTWRHPLLLMLATARVLPQLLAQQAHLLLLLWSEAPAQAVRPAMQLWQRLPAKAASRSNGPLQSLLGLLQRLLQTSCFAACQALQVHVGRGAAAAAALSWTRAVCGILSSWLMLASSFPWRSCNPMQSWPCHSSSRQQVQLWP